MDIRINLTDELNDCASKMMTKKGFKWSETSPISIFQQYMNLLNREVEPTPRKVCISEQLDCPEQVYNGFKALLYALKNGLNVNGYLSSNLIRAHYNDGFLNDFGFHHFHLGVGICQKGKSKGFVNRTKAVLVAYITHDCAYLIGIYDHGKNAPHLWVDQRLVEIMHTEWPEAIQKFRLNGLQPQNERLSVEQRSTLRSKGYNTCIEMPDGTIYASIGGGITAAKTNSNLTIEYDRFYLESESLIRELSKYLSQQHDLLMVFPVILKLKGVTNGLLFQDVSNNIYYLLQKTSIENLRIIKYVPWDITENYPYGSGLKVNKISEFLTGYKTNKAFKRDSQRLAVLV